MQDLRLQHFIKCSVWSYLEHDIPRELADQGAVRLRWTKCPIKWPFELSSIFDLDTSNCPIGVLARCGKHQRATIDNWHMSNTACQCQLSEEQTNNNLIHQMGLNPVPKTYHFLMFQTPHIHLYDLHALRLLPHQQTNRGRIAGRKEQLKLNIFMFCGIWQIFILHQDMFFTYWWIDDLHMYIYISPYRCNMPDFPLPGEIVQATYCSTWFLGGCTNAHAPPTESPESLGAAGT